MVAAESAKFTMAYSKIAASPDGSSSYFLPRLIGLRRALELHYTNRVLSAREALDWGLVTRVHPDREFSSAVATLSKELAKGPTIAFGRAKLLFHQSTQESLESQMELEAQAIAGQRSHRGLQEWRRRVRQEAAAGVPRKIETARVTCRTFAKMVRWVCRFLALQVTHHRVIVAVSELSGLLKHVQIRGYVRFTFQTSA